MIVVLGGAGYVVIAAAMTAMARMPLQPGRIRVRRAQDGSPLLTAALVSSRELPAASTERRVYVITDAK